MAEAALEKDPSNREANRIIGSVFAALAEQRQAREPGDDPATYVPRAIGALERARQEGGSDVALDLTLGRLYLQSKACDKAIPLLRRVVAQQPATVRLPFCWPRPKRERTGTTDAVATLRASLDENPKSLRGWVMLGELSEKQSEWESAADAYARAQDLNPRLDLSTRRAGALLNAGNAVAARTC